MWIDNQVLIGTVFHVDGLCVFVELDDGSFEYDFGHNDWAPSGEADRTPQFEAVLIKEMVFQWTKPLSRPEDV